MTGFTRRPVRRALAATLGIGLAFAQGQAVATEPGTDPPEQSLARLAAMSLEELMRTEVVTVSGRPRPQIATPAAVTVITGEDVRRSGHRSIVEALRMVPGMYVGRINSGSWVAGARGLTGTSLTSNRYLVLVDGRLVYDPLVSTTFWDTVDVPLPDLDRIEVVRGPGATLWGVNAMNGVINIITKRASATAGTLVQAGGGSNGEHGLLVRHGAADADSGWRVWLKYDAHGDFEDPAGDSLGDAWSALRGGFRRDGQLTGAVGYTLQGDAYAHPRAGQRVQLPVPGENMRFEQVAGDATVEGANLLFRAHSGRDAEEGWMLRAYWDHTRRDSQRYGASRHTTNLEYRRWLGWGERQQLIWGVQYDLTGDRIDNGPVLRFDPSRRHWDTLNAFVQNTTELVPERLFLMLGSKFTEHSFVGFQVQPSARLWWTPSEHQTLWAAVSRPVRVPSRFEEDGLLVFAYADVGGRNVPIGLAGDKDLRPERLLAWEAGHRVQLGPRWVLDTALFYNDYRRLIGVPESIVGSFTDAASGATWGGSVSASARFGERLHVEASWSELRTRIDGPVYPYEETGTPERLAQLRGYLDLGDNVKLNGALYHASRVPLTGTPAYTRADLGLAWRPRPGLEFSLWGRNLLDASHPEASGAQVPRGVYAQVVYSLAP